LRRRPVDRGASPRLGRGRRLLGAPRRALERLVVRREGRLQERARRHRAPARRPLEEGRRVSVPGAAAEYGVAGGAAAAVVEAVGRGTLRWGGVYTRQVTVQKGDAEPERGRSNRLRLVRAVNCRL